LSDQGTVGYEAISGGSLGPDQHDLVDLLTRHLVRFGYIAWPRAASPSESKANSNRHNEQCFVWILRIA